MATPATKPEAPSAPSVHPKPFWSFRPQSDRESGDAIASNFMLHWFPAKVFKPSMEWTYSFWLGTISAALLLLLTVSGLPLLFLYVPSVERAYQSVKDIEYVVSFGAWIRSVHRFSAHLMVVAVFLHLVRVFLTGAYKNGTARGQHREWNWVIGVVMLVFTMFLSFTGYLLPWDQLAFWAVTVGTNIAASIPLVGPQIRELFIGGRTIEQPTLIRFYVLHVIAVLGTFAVISMWAVLVRSPLEEAANPLITPNPAKAPWYFLWLQEIVTDTTFRIGSLTGNGAFIGGVLLPGLLIVVLTVWPWLDKSPGAAAGTWFPANRKTQNLVFIGIAIVIIIFTLIGVFLRGPYWQFNWPWEAWPSIPTRI